MIKSYTCSSIKENKFKNKFGICFNKFLYKKKIIKVSWLPENLTARNECEQLWLVDMRCEAGCRHQANGDDKLAAIDTPGCYFGEGAGTEWGRKLAAIKSTRGSIRSGEEGTKIKRR